MFVLHVVLESVWLYLGVRLLFDQVRNLDPRLEREAVSIVTGAIVIGVGALIVAWFVVAVIMHVGCGGGKRGTFTDAFGVAGWAYAPEVVLFLPSAIYGWWEIRHRSFDGSDPERLVAEFDAIASQTDLAAVLIALATTLWSVYILTYGIAETHDIPVDRAATPAVVVGLGSILFFLIN